MNYILIVFASVTTATRIKTLLAKKFGIDSVVIQTPKSIGEKTCSYCLKAKEEHMETIWKIVNDNKLASKGIFREGDYARLK